MSSALAGEGEARQTMLAAAASSSSWRATLPKKGSSQL
jgi:hypothetical protein